MPADAHFSIPIPVPSGLLTTEDQAALKALPSRLRERRIPQAIRDLERLPVWAQAFAYWLAFQPYRVSVSEQCRQASGLARDRVSANHLRRLRARDDFRALIEKFQAGGVEGALEKLKTDLPYYVDTHKKGLEMAVAAEDYAAIPKYTLHALEIVAPRRNDLGQQNVQVNVTFNEKQIALEETPTLEVTVEPVAPTPSE